MDKIKEQKGKCPYCKTSYKKDVYTLFPDLAIVDPTLSNNEVLQRTRQRVIHVINHLGVMSSAEQMRDAYNSAREHRAYIRNAATGCDDPDFETLTLAVTDAVDSLEERLHYSLQKQDLANSIIDMKRKLKSSAASHEVERAALNAEVRQLKLKFRHEEKERNKATVTLESYKESLKIAILEKNTLTKRTEDQAARIDGLQTQLDTTKAERGNFQGQLEEYRKKALKQRAVMSQLKQEIEELKAKAVQKPPKAVAKAGGTKHTSAPSFPIPTWPFVPPPEASRLPGSPSYIDLCSSSPRNSSVSSPVPAAPLSRKRPRAPDENRFEPNGPVLLSPPKVRAGGPSRARNEVLETVSSRSNGEIRRWAAGVKPKGVGTSKPAATAVAKRVPSYVPAAQPQLALGDGKLLGVMKRRKVRAV